MGNRVSENRPPLSEIPAGGFACGHSALSMEWIGCFVSRRTFSCEPEIFASIRGRLRTESREGCRIRVALRGACLFGRSARKGCRRTGEGCDVLCETDVAGCRRIAGRRFLRFRRQTRTGFAGRFSVCGCGSIDPRIWRDSAGFSLRGTSRRPVIAGSFRCSGFSTRRRAGPSVRIGNADFPAPSAAAGQRRESVRFFPVGIRALRGPSAGDDGQTIAPAG